MHLYDFVWTSFPDRTVWLNGARDKDQGAVLAFDFNVSNSWARPPAPNKYGYRWSSDPDANTASGPWCAGVNKVHGEGYVHSEEQLLEKLPLYIERHKKEHLKNPSSVSLYTYYSPCESCVESMRDTAWWLAPDEGIEFWYLYFDQCYVDDSDERSSKKKAKQKYRSFDEQLNALKRFSIWKVDTLHF